APTTVTLRLVDDNGTLLQTRTVQLAARGKSWISAQNFFVAPSTTVTQGYVEITSDRTNIGGSVVFGDPARSSFASALPLVSRLQAASIFSQVASDTTYYTGVAVLNPSNADTSFTLDVFDDRGNMVATRTLPLQARRRSVGLLTGYFPQLGNRRGGY